MPKVTVVLPTYNGESFLDQSIESVVAQTFTDWELIVVDDCSTDETPGIISKWVRADSRIRVIRNAQNKKLPGSLNEGFLQATGLYYTWTSDDNCFRPDALEMMVNALESDESASLVYCGIQRIDERGALISQAGISGPPSVIHLFNVVQACFMYRSEVHRRLGGYDEGLFLVEDYDFWIRAHRYFKFIRIRQAPYFYRVHSGSLTSTRKKEIRKKACDLMWREMSLPGQSLGDRASALIGYCYNKLQYFLA